MSFNDASSMEIVASHGRMTGKKMEGRSCGLNEALSRNLPVNVHESHGIKESVKIAGDTVRIRTKHLPNINL